VSYLGLDIGTTGCKAVTFDREGAQLARAYREYPIERPAPGCAELDPDRVMAACRDVVREAAALSSADPVEALSVSSQGEAFTPVDAALRPLAKAMVSSDTRASSQVDTLLDRIGPERLYEITGHTSHPMFSIFKLAWLRQNAPAVWSAAEKFLCFEDLMHARLGIEPHIGYPLAGRTMLFDERRACWSGELLELAGLDERRLARTAEPGSVVGRLDSAAAGRFGLAAGTPVVAGGHDQVIAALGAGVSEAGTAAYAIGTVECLCPLLGEPTFGPFMRRGNLCTYRSAIPGAYASVAFSLTGGNLLRWFRDEWAREEVRAAAASGADAYDLILEALPAEPSDVLVVPYFTPSGTPNFDTQTKGAILGLRLGTTRGEVLRALLEGVAFEMKLNLALLEQSGSPLGCLIATGGGSRSARLIQLKADVLGRPIRVNAQPEAGCLGAAMLCISALTGEPVREVAARLSSAKDAVEPDARRSAQYAARMEVYRRAYAAVSRAGV
jgi:xylulokinase